MFSLLASNRNQPFNANEWRLFGAWLDHLDKGITVAYELSQHGDQSTGALGVSDAVTGVRWYATDLALFDALVFRAAGLREDETVCFDQELSDLHDELDADHPNCATCATPYSLIPRFVDEVVGPDEALISSGRMASTSLLLRGGAAQAIIDPFAAHMRLPSIIDRVRAVFSDRRATAIETETGNNATGP